MSSSRALCCLPSVKKQKYDSRFASLTEQDIEKIVEDKDHFFRPIIVQNFTRYWGG